MKVYPPGIQPDDASSQHRRDAGCLGPALKKTCICSPAAYCKAAGSGECVISHYGRCPLLLQGFFLLPLKTFKWDGELVNPWSWQRSSIASCWFLLSTAGDAIAISLGSSANVSIVPAS